MLVENFREKKKEKKKRPLVLKCNFPNILQILPKVETSLYHFQYNSSFMDAVTGNEYYKKETSHLTYLCSLGKKDGLRTFS